MRRCPTCQRTYEGSLKFCQADGTPLIDESAAAPMGGFGLSTESADDQNDFANSDLDPMKTMIGAPPANLPPPSPFNDPPNSHGLSAPSFGDLESSPQPAQPQSASSDFAPGSSSQPTNSYGSESDNFNSAPSFKEPEPQFGNQAGYNQNSFGQSPTEWNPPPAPQDWQNQGLNQNTPFNAPPIQSTGQNLTLPIISLVFGILSVCCYFSPLTGLVALITGYLSLKNIKTNPAIYGGRGLALAGMITGGIFFALGVIYWILIILGVALGGLR